MILSISASSTQDTIRQQPVGTLLILPYLAREAAAPADRHVPPPPPPLPDKTFPLHLFLEECDDNDGDDTKAEAGESKKEGNGLTVLRRPKENIDFEYHRIGELNVAQKIWRMIFTIGDHCFLRRRHKCHKRNLCRPKSCQSWAINDGGGARGAHVIAPGKKFGLPSGFLPFVLSAVLLPCSRHPMNVSPSTLK